MSEKLPGINEKKLSQFKSWLNAQGAQVLPITSEWEAIRFAGKKGTGVIYTNSSGRYSPSSNMTVEAWDAFVNCKPWSGRGKPTKRSGGSKRRRQLLDRDGEDCFFCGLPMNEKDRTLEHLVPVIQQGPNTLPNMALAHRACNQIAGNMGVVEKVKLRDRLRGFAPHPNSWGIVTEDDDVLEMGLTQREAEERLCRLCNEGEDAYLYHPEEVFLE